MSLLKKEKSDQEKSKNEISKSEPASPNDLLDMNIFDENLPEQEALRIFKKIYIDRITNYYSVSGKELNRFMWSENKRVTMYFVKVHDDKFSPDVSIIFFCVPSKKDQIKKYDLVSETSGYNFDKLLIAENKLSWLIENKLLPKNIKENIEKSSIQSSIGFDELKISSANKIFITNWCDFEYHSTDDSLSKPTEINSLPTTNKKFFVDRYHFNDMLSTIDDDQFTDEFNQCLFAYEHEKWFLCAAGLGSCLEHLMLLTLTNYSKQGSLGRNPTAKDYLKAFEKEPISIDSRQQTFIDTLFRVRNSVDHHNSGHTQKNLCDMLLDGISDIFNDYFVPSTLVSSSK